MLPLFALLGHGHARLHILILLVLDCLHAVLEIVREGPGCERKVAIPCEFRLSGVLEVRRLRDPIARVDLLGGLRPACFFALLYHFVELIELVGVLLGLVALFLRLKPLFTADVVTEAACRCTTDLRHHSHLVVVIRRRSFIVGLKLSLKIFLALIAKDGFRHLDSLRLQLRCRLNPEHLLLALARRD